MKDAWASGTAARAATTVDRTIPSLFTCPRVPAARPPCHPSAGGCQPYIRIVVRVRFAPSPTGSLHLGGALSAVANRAFADEHGGRFLLRIDDTDATRNVDGGAEAIVADLEWLRGPWGEGPLRQSGRFPRHPPAAHLNR